MHKIDLFERKKLASDAFYVYLMQLILYLVPLVSVGILTRRLGVDMYGKYAMAMSLVSLCVIINSAGLPVYGISLISKGASAKNFTGAAFKAISMVKILNYFIFILPLMLLAINKAGDSISIYNVWPLFLMPFFNCFSSDWLLQGIQKPIFPVLSQSISSIFFLIFITILICDENDLRLLCIITSISTCLNTLILISTMKFFNIQFWTPIGINLYDTYKVLMDYFFAELGHAFKTQGGVFIIGFFSGSNSAGLYAVADKLYLAAQALLIPINRILFPYMNLNSDKTLIKIILNLSIMMLLVIPTATYLLSPLVILKLFGEAYLNSVDILNILSICFSFSLISTLVGYPMLGIVKNCKIVNMTAIISSIFFLLLCLISGFFDRLTPIVFASILLISIVSELLLRIFALHREKQ